MTYICIAAVQLKKQENQDKDKERYNITVPENGDSSITSISYSLLLNHPIICDTYDYNFHGIKMNSLMDWDNTLRLGITCIAENEDGQNDFHSIEYQIWIDVTIWQRHVYNLYIFHV